MTRNRAADLVARDNYLTNQEAEMRRAGLYDADASYGGGAIAKCVLELLDTWHKQGHSGGSAMMTLQVFNRLVDHKVLSPLTDDPAEWMDVAEYQNGEALWQNRRQSTCFSLDGGKTYYDIDEKRSWWRKFFKLGYQGFTMHQTAAA